jgi:hypothetical protein
VVAKNTTTQNTPKPASHYNQRVFSFHPKIQKNTLSLRFCFFGFGGRAPGQLVGIIFSGRV